MSVSRDTSGDAMAEALAPPPPLPATPQAAALLWGQREELTKLLSELDGLLKRVANGTKEYRLRSHVDEMRGRCSIAFARLADVERVARTNTGSGS